MAPLGTQWCALWRHRVPCGRAVSARVRCGRAVSARVRCGRRGQGRGCAAGLVWMARLRVGANGVWRAAFELYREELGKSALTRGENRRSCNFRPGVIVDRVGTGGPAGTAPAPRGLHRCRSRGCGGKPGPVRPER
jgi:hypothetical protein